MLDDMFFSACPPERNGSDARVLGGNNGDGGTIGSVVGRWLGGGTYLGSCPRAR